MDGCILRMCGINKSFFGVPVLKNAQLEVLPGEVHVLLGENGAGNRNLILYRICLYMKIYSLERNTARGFLWTISVP